MKIDPIDEIRELGAELALLEQDETVKRYLDVKANMNKLTSQVAMDRYGVGHCGVQGFRVGR